MGIGNLESVIAAYTGEDVRMAGAAELVDEEGLDYPRLLRLLHRGALRELGSSRGSATIRPSTTGASGRRRT